MATYYVRTDGNDGNAGTGPASGNAWQTVGKALGVAGIASGDTVYIAPGTYRESVTVGMTSATVETLVIGDVDSSQFSDIAPGVVRLTAYTTNDTTAPSGANVLNTNGKNNLTFQDLLINGGTTAAVSILGVSIKFLRCCVITGARSVNCFLITGTVDVSNAITIDSCVCQGSGTTVVAINLPTSSAADYDTNILIKNSVLTSWGATSILVAGTGALAFKAGGVRVFNCSLFGGTSMNVSTAVLASTAPNQCEIYNCVLLGGSGLAANTLGQLIENYNLIYGTLNYTNVTAGANSVASTTTMTHALMMDFGSSALWGFVPRPWLEPMSGSPQLGRGTSGSATVTTDILSRPRPSGGASASKSWGAYERGNTFGKETGTVRTGTSAVSITGPGVQDFELPVDTSATTATAYVQWDATYAGTKPQMVVLNGEEVGVATATTTAIGSSGSWEQLSLTFTATKIGIVTIRLQSNDTNGAGHMYADDFAVT